MRSTGDADWDADCDAGALAGGGVVVVGVTLEGESKQLLTWGLVKVAQPGDCVIALHVLKTPPVDKSSLLSLVNAFHAVLNVYEGFCNLKQVDLQLKICRGSSARKTLVLEAKMYDGARVVVGTSKSHHRIRSSAKLAKYCARHLPKQFWVMAVDYGKVVFERKWSNLCRIDGQEKLDGESQISSPKSSRKKIREKKCRDNEPVMLLKLSKQTLAEEFAKENSLALVNSLSRSGTIIISDSPKLISCCPLFQPKMLHRLQHSNRKNKPMLQGFFRRPSRGSYAVVHPDQKQNGYNQDENVCSNLDGETGAIVPIAYETASSGVCSNLDGETGAIVPIGYETASPRVCSNLDGETGAVVPIGYEIASSHVSLETLPKELEYLYEKYSSTCKLFSYQELLSASSNFTPGNLVGKGGTSHVYRGCLPYGTQLAIKILKPSEDRREFISEIEIITTLHHKNIIFLYGFCFEDNHLILVYDLLPRGSLEDNLHGHKNGGSTFGWKERQKVAVGVAEALDYLHNWCAEPVIHMDVKSSNILLADDFEPQLSDFGLANWASSVLSESSCGDVAGTFGYVAPEYFMQGKVSDKIDVYAYGVVLLELLSGKKPINSEHPKGRESLAVWANPILKEGKVSQLLDPNLGNDYNHDETERMALAASLCIRHSPKLRPQISVILKLLQGDKEVIEWARQQVRISDELEDVDGKSIPANILSHINLALLDLQDDTLSICSSEQSVMVEDYLQGRWSRSSSFD